MNFKFDEFVKYVHEIYAADFSLEEVKEILFLEEDGYNKSVPDSPQKRLLLRRIILEGKKNEDTTFKYDRPLYSGVSMWVADNLKGKSTIFKAIGFALTGRDKFTPLVKTWLKYIALEFSIKDAVYSVVLNLTGAQLKAAVYSSAIDSLAGEEPLRSFKSKDGLADFMQELFFEEFDYYPIKRVQASQPSINLSDADLTWVSYYSSIYHQSKDYGNLDIGNQHAMVFQMLLGLEYTFSIHALEAKAKKAEREWSLKTEQEKNQSITVEDLQKMQNDLIATNEQILKLRTNTEKKAIEAIEERLHSFQQSRETTRKEKMDGEDRLYQMKTAFNSSQVEIKEKQDLIQHSTREINKLRKLIVEYQDYIDSGIFFNNLEVTECPHCDHEVDKDKRLLEKESKICMLCDHEMTAQVNDIEIWQLRIQEAKQEIERNRLLSETENQVLINIEQKVKINDKKFASLENEVLKLENVLENLDKSIKEAEGHRNQLRATIEGDYFSKFENLLEQKIKTENQIAVAEKQATLRLDNKLKRKAELLRTGHELMLKSRKKLGQATLFQLEEIMLNQLHSLGLSSYTRVVINPDNFIIHYHQGNVVNNFNDISEGEQLRAKLALYLSLIELDLEKGVGRHPRLIILDSPTKEEADIHFVEGLKKTLLHIEEKFGEQVQVMVGTANRELASIIKSAEKLDVSESGQFVF
ncbi:coiled-coil domain-containing protein [Pedobacter endophyticus]|uniref:AAA domain-containing protein n=1 Tax=Pedobacter endophyticus TaxID=2789740 RepID=A0A7U3Q3G7_9SPHI|nr:hypothetical protein [Pedobacter endophyticus]QPH37885.1 hypothetical protein IZT61_12265 [Pedobacter endophyticus]